MAACTWAASMVWAPALAAWIQAARASRHRLRAKPLLALVKRWRAAGSMAGRLMPTATRLCWRYWLPGSPSRDPGSVAGNAREEGTVLAQAQGAQQVFVADEHQAEGGRFGQVEAQEQTHFFEAAITEALGFVQDDQRARPCPVRPRPLRSGPGWFRGGRWPACPVWRPAPRASRSRSSWRGSATTGRTGAGPAGSTSDPPERTCPRRWGRPGA